MSWINWGDPESAAVRVRDRVGQAIAGVIAVVFLFGPPLWTVRGIISDTPLYATEEVMVTTTNHYGVIPEMAPILLLWVLILSITYGMATGRLPRMR